MRNAAAAVLAIAALLAAFSGIGVLNPVQEPVPQGDMLGMHHGETLKEYQRRTGGPFDPRPAFALVSFDPPATPVEAAAAVEGVARVNAVVVKQKAPVAVPEPVEGQSRIDVFARAGHPIVSLVVHADGMALQELEREASVFAVEALPPDAVWGAFGITEVRS